MPQTKKRYKYVKISFDDLEKSIKMGLPLDQLKKLKQSGVSLEKVEQARTTHLWRTIQKKLDDRKVVACLAYSVLMALKKKKYAGSPDDKITNPLAIDNNGCKPLYENIEEKRIAFELGVEDGMNAYTGFKEYIPLGGPGAAFNDVEFIGGLWRVQKKFPYKITQVRDRQFVLVEKLPRAEKNKFEYYTAAAAVWSGTGCSADVAKPNWIVAKYETPRGTFMSYGQSIEQARAFLAISIHDEYQNLIHDAAFEK